MTHPICSSCETVAHCMNHGCVPKQALKPCRSPYCECDHGKCSHPGCYDARGEAWPPKPSIKHLLPPRLQEWYSIGPVQRAELEQFAEAVLNTRAVGVTADGFFVEPGNRVWVISSTGAPKPTTVQKTQALTSYYLFGQVPVSESWIDRQALERFQHEN